MAENNNQSSISKEELDERISILKRYKKLLEQQRAKFQEYLKVLESQQNCIEAENPESIYEHTILEEQIMKNLSNLQKVIVPMNELYKQTSGNKVLLGEAKISESDKAIFNLQDELNSLQKKVLAQNSRNQELLKSHIVSVKKQLSNFKNPYAYKRSVYGQPQAQLENIAKFVEIQA